MLARTLLDLSRILALFRVAFKYFVQPMLRRIAIPSTRPQSFSVGLRLSLEELGLTYVKLGQYLSTRFDLLPSETCRELNKLLEEVEPVPFAQVGTVIEKELQRPLHSLFSRFTEKAIASASVAQVYEAWTWAGEHVAVKVQRPGIESVFAADMRNLRRLADLVDFFKLLGSLSMREMVEAFATWTVRELDFREEGRTADRLRSTAVAGEIIPRVYWNLTTARVLTLEFVEGVSLSRLAILLEQGRSEEISSLLPKLDIERVGHLLATACLQQFFVSGFFHGDPHPGNILVQKDNAVAFIDFGIFCELNQYHREILAGLIENIAVGNVDQSFYYYSKQAIPSPETDVRAFATQGKAVLRRWYDSYNDPAASMQTRHLGKFSVEMFEIVRRNQVRMSAETLLFWRAMNALAATAVRLPQHIDLLGEMRAFFRQLRPTPWQRLVEPFFDTDHLAAMAAVVIKGLGQYKDIQDSLVSRYQCDIWDMESPEVEA